MAKDKKTPRKSKTTTQQEIGHAWPSTNPSSSSRSCPLEPYECMPT